MRKFYLENSAGARLDLQSDLYFLWEPEGLGAGDGCDYAEIEYGFFGERETRYLQPEISGMLVLRKGAQEPYASYRQFVDWVCAAADGLKLAYAPYAGRELYMDVRVSSLELTEKTGVGVLECPVTFTGLSPWHRKNPLAFLFQTDATENPMRFTFSFPFRFSSSGAGNALTFTPSGHFPAALELTVNGPVSAPRFQCENAATGEVYGVLDLPGAAVAAGDRIVYSSRPNADGVWLVSGSARTDLTHMLNVNNENFFRVPAGAECLATLSADMEDGAQASHALYVHEYFRG